MDEQRPETETPRSYSLPSVVALFLAIAAVIGGAIIISDLSDADAQGALIWDSVLSGPAVVLAITALIFAVDKG